MSKPLIPKFLTSPSHTAQLEAYKYALSKAESLRVRIMLEIDAHPNDGITTDELEERLGLSHQTASARVSELKKMGLIETRDGVFRPTRSGKRAAVLFAA